MSVRELGRRLTDLPLFWQIFLPNVIVLAIAAAVLALTPASVSSRPSTGQALGLFIALVVIVLINLVLIRRAVAPVERLTEVMAHVDPLEPGQRAPTDGGSAENDVSWPKSSMQCSSGSRPSAARAGRGCSPHRSANGCGWRASFMTRSARASPG